MHAASLTLELTDDELLTLCLRGERNAFGSLVSRYQSLVSAQAYAVCGDLTCSEDVAQEAFISAWRQLPQLRERAKFRSWLCGIARRLALRVVERRERERAFAERETEPQAGAGATPHQAMISQEEERLVWSALEELPESYRTPLVMHYRDQHALAQIADALAISEEAAKQRLCRGRAMLKQQVIALVENTLQRSRPGPGFTAAVLCAVAGIAPVSATAATIGAASTPIAASAVKSAAALPWLGALSGVGLGVLGGWLGVSISAENASYEAERKEIYRSAWRIVIGVAVQLAVMALLIAAYSAGHWGGMPVFTGCMATMVGYVAWLWWEIIGTNRRLRLIRATEQQRGTPLRTQAAAWQAAIRRRGQYYCSKAKLLGIPLLSISWNAPDASREERRTAFGWVAAGERAVGFLAFGPVAIGVFAVGAFSIGAISLGAVAVGGVCALGGIGAAPLAYGGVALGWAAHGGMAMAVQTAFGGFAVALEHALGGFAAGAHANDATARAAVQNHWWFRLTNWPGFPMITPGITVLCIGLLHAWTKRFVARQMD